MQLVQKSKLRIFEQHLCKEKDEYHNNRISTIRTYKSKALTDFKLEIYESVQGTQLLRYVSGTTNPVLHYI